MGFRRQIAAQLGRPCRLWHEQGLLNEVCRPSQARWRLLRYQLVCQHLLHTRIGRALKNESRGSELIGCRYPGRTAFAVFNGRGARLLAQALAHAGHISLVADVFEIEPELPLPVEFIADHGAVHPIGREFPIACRGDIARAHEAHPIAHRPALGQCIGGPQVQRMARRIAQRLAHTRRLVQ